MLLTFFELTIGLHILGIENALVIAFLIAIFDVLPVLGTGGIMLPWILISFLNNQAKTGVGLLILYLVITVIRNIIEPKIVGKQIGRASSADAYVHVPGGKAVRLSRYLHTSDSHIDCTEFKRYRHHPYL